jgi:hypothetical protein
MTPHRPEVLNGWMQTPVNPGLNWAFKNLRASLDFGNTYADAASTLFRDEPAVRQKAKELGLIGRRKKMGNSAEAVGAFSDRPPPEAAVSYAWQHIKFGS